VLYPASTTDTALYRTVEAMRVELPSRLAAGPRVIKRNWGNGGRGVWKVEPLANPRNRRPVLTRRNGVAAAHLRGQPHQPTVIATTAR
jgi:hypothetical protein